jgi:hypothetical protein
MVQEGGWAKIRNPKFEIRNPKFLRVLSSCDAAVEPRRGSAQGATMGPWLVEAHTRDDLDAWLQGGPPEFSGSSIMIVRGDDLDVRAFLPNALDAAKLDEDRIVVWLKDPGLLDNAERKHLFGEGDEVLAVVLTGAGEVGSWMTRDRVRVEDAEFAFAEAEE